MPAVTTSLGPFHVDETGSGPPVVMWPSLFCDGTSLRPQAEELARDHRVLVLDPPGHGRTPAPPARFRLEATAVALGELMDACRAPSAIIVGNAWGGMVATQLAITQPDRIVALVLMNCPFHEWAGVKRLQLRLAHWLLVTLGPRRVAKMIFSSMVAPETRAADPDRHLELQRAPCAPPSAPASRDPPRAPCSIAPNSPRHSTWSARPRSSSPATVIPSTP